MVDEICPYKEGKINWYCSVIHSPCNTLFMKSCTIFSLKQIVDGKKGIKELENQRNKLQYKLALQYTNCLLIARDNHYQKIIEYLESDPQSLVNLNDTEIEIIPIEEEKEPEKEKSQQKEKEKEKIEKKGKQTTLF